MCSVCVLDVKCVLMPLYVHVHLRHTCRCLFICSNAHVRLPACQSDYLSLLRTYTSWLVVAAPIQVHVKNFHRGRVNVKNWFNRRQRTEEHQRTYLREEMPPKAPARGEEVGGRQNPKLGAGGRGRRVLLGAGAGQLVPVLQEDTTSWFW